MNGQQNNPTSMAKENLQSPQVPLSNQEVIQAKKSRKWPVIILVIFALIILGITGTFAYQNYRLKEKTVAKKGGFISPPVSDEIISPTPTVDPTTDWLTYTGENICFTFKYPKGFTLDEESPAEENKMAVVFWAGPTQTTDTEFFDGISILFSYPLEVENTSLSDYVDSKIEEIKKEGISEIIKPKEEIKEIKEIKVFTFTSQGLGTWENIFVQSLDKTCTVEITNATIDPDNKGYQEVAEMILSTFKFIN